VGALDGSRPRTVTISLNSINRLTGKLTDAELHFVGCPLAGPKLLGFASWEHRAGRHYVTFPGRQYGAAGQRRLFTLLRDISGQSGSQALRDLIVKAYAAELPAPVKQVALRARQGRRHPFIVDGPSC
jgi:hypothetical protein